MAMSTITVAGINPSLNILGTTQQFIFSQNRSTFRLNNTFIPTSFINSETDFETVNNMLSGFRWFHRTTDTDTYGSLTLQSFINAQPSENGTDILQFNSSGIGIFANLDLNGNIITNAIWNGSTITVPYGGTGVASTTAYAVLCGGTTSTGAFQSVASVGTTGQVLTSQGIGALPTWSSLIGVTSITAGTGLSGGTITTFGTIAIANTAVTAGSYTYGNFTVNAQGQLTAASSGTTPVTSITAGTGLSGGTITGVGTIDIASTAVTPGSYTYANFTVNAQGQLTAASSGTTPIIVANGGTGLASTTAYSVLCGGTTSTGAFQSVASVGTSGQVLTSQGVGALPIWNTITGTGTVTSITAGTGLSGGTITTTGTVAIANTTVTAGSYTYGNFTVNAQGQLTAASNGTTPVIVANGGTGVASVTAYSILCGGTTSTAPLQSVSSLGTTGQVLTSQGAGALPTWSAVSGTGTVTSITAGVGLNGGTITTSGTIDLANTAVTAGSYTYGNFTVNAQGQLTAASNGTTPISLSNGGTNANLTASNGGIFYSTTTAGAILSGTATANQVLLSGSSAAPSWSTATYPSSTTINQILYSSAANTISAITTANNGVLITSSGGIPSIGTTLPSVVQGNITSLSTITSGTWNGSTITVPYGGTGVASTTAYAVLCGGTISTGAFQAVSGLGTTGQVLTSQGASALPIWSTIATGSGTVTSITAGSNLTGGTITTTGTIALSNTPAGLTSIGVGNLSLAASTISNPNTNGNIILAPNGTGSVQLNNGATVTPLQFYNAAGTQYVALQAGSLAGNTTWTLPTTDGTSSQVLTTNGSGVLSWSTPSAGTGTVTSITAGVGLNGGTITASGTIDIANTAVTPGSYIYGSFTVNAQGQLTAASNGTTITVPNGGTGVTSTTAYSVLCGGTTSTGALQSVVSLGTSGQVLTSQGAAALPTWSTPTTGTVTSITAGTGLSGGTITTSGTIAIANTAVTAGSYTYGNFTVNAQGQLTAASSGTTPISLANGGTNASLTASNGGIFYSTATAAAVLSGTATANQVLLSGASSTPSWGSSIIDTSGGLVNLFIGTSAGNTTTTGGLNVGIGNQALLAITTGANDIAIGYQTLKANTTGADNTAIGTQALSTNITSSNNTAIGSNALKSTTVGSLTAVGYQALKSNTTGTQNIAAGFNALLANTTGSSNTAIGYNALLGNTTGSFNTAIGLEALKTNTTTGALTAIGYNALLANTSGNHNTAIGYNTLPVNTTGANNTAIGFEASQANITAANNTAIGSTALILNTGAQNTAIGSGTAALRAVYTSCTFLGYNADASVSGLTNAIAIGASASVGTSNSMVLGNGAFVGIGQNSPAYSLHLGTDNSSVPLLYIASSSVPSAPATANDGIYSVATGKAKFTSGTAVSSGTIVTANSTGAATTAGVGTLNGTTGVVVSTTAIQTTSIVNITRNNGTSGAPLTTSVGYLSVGSISAGISFTVYSTNALDTFGYTWNIINP